MGAVGYPSFILYIAVLIGMPLAFKRPFLSFLLVVFAFSAADTQAFTHTRTLFLGPYFNANDACLLIALLAMLRYIYLREKTIQFPKVTKWIIAVLLIGFVQSWFLRGWTYEALRALRWAMNLPFYFIIAATMVDRKEKVRPLLIALFFGSVVSAIQHIVFVRFSIDVLGVAFSQFRTISFLGVGTFFVLASLIWVPKMKEREKLILVSACILFVISILLNQTRSIWFSSIAVFPIALLTFRHKNIDAKIVMFPVVLIGLLLGTLAITGIITPEISFIDMIIERFLSLESGAFTRLISFQEEMTAWFEGTLIFGRGLSFFGGHSDEFVAWGHLGHVTTLSQLGLIGLAAYSFYLPATIIKASRKLWRYSTREVRFLGLFAGIAIMWYWICFFISGSFLSQHSLTGIIFGAAWRQAMLIRREKY